MGENIGKIRLDLEVSSDISKQVSAITGAMGKNIESALAKSLGRTKKQAQDSVKATAGGISDNVNKSMSDMGLGLRKRLTATMAALRKVKAPKMSIPFARNGANSVKAQAEPSADTTKGLPADAVSGSADSSRVIDLKNKIRATTEQAEKLRREIAGMDSQKVPTAEFTALQKEIEKTEQRLLSLLNRQEKLEEVGKVRKGSAQWKGLKYDIEATDQLLSRLEERMRAMQAAGDASAPRSATAEYERKQSALQQLMAKLDVYKAKLSEVGAKENEAAASTRRASTSLGGMGVRLRSSSRSGSTLSAGMRRLGSSMGGVSSGARRLGWMLPGLNSHIKKTSRNSSMASTSMGRFMRTLIVSRVLMSAAVRALSALGGYMLSCLKTNSQFSSSLSQVQMNLKAAFMPIYQAILPAINALMGALSTVTVQIAGFISALFGKTYLQSVKAASGMDAAREAMDSYGSSASDAAKEAQKHLMGFDEVNKVDNPASSDSGSGGGGGSGLGAAGAESEAIGLAAKMKSLLSKIFQPFKESWAAEGQNTVASIRHAFSGIWNLAKEIGKSFLEVWTNGTGTKLLATMHKILQNIFNLVGDVGNTFAEAWEKGGIGTKVVQNIADALQLVLDIINSMGGSLIKVWGEIGPAVAGAFMGILKSTSEVLRNIAEKLKLVWDKGGKHLFEGLVKLGAKLFELAGYVYTGFAAPFAMWLQDLLAPAFAAVLDVAGWLLDRITALIDWLMNDGKPVLDVIVTVLGSVAVAFTAIRTAISAVTGVVKVATTVAGALSSAIGLLASPIGIATVVIGALIAAGVLLYKNWDTVRVKAGEIWEKVKQVFQGFSAFVTGLFKNDWTNTFGVLGDVLNAFFRNLSNIWGSIKQIFNGITTFIKGVFTGNWRQAFQGLCDIIKGVFGGIVSVVRAPINAVIGILNGFIRGLNRIRIPSWVPALGGKGINIPSIPYLAKGGLIDSPTLAMVGEQGKEAVMPLENNTGWINQLADKIAARNGIRASGGISKAEMQEIMSQFANEVITAMGRMGFYVDGELLARMVEKGMASFNRRFEIT